jgi:hypothetical protein
LFHIARGQRGKSWLSNSRFSYEKQSMIVLATSGWVPVGAKLFLTVKKNPDRPFQGYLPYEIVANGFRYQLFGSSFAKDTIIRVTVSTE